MLWFYADKIFSNPHTKGWCTMKKFLLFALILVFSPILAEAKTIYLEVDQDKKNTVRGMDEVVLANEITRWEEKNPDKEIVCWVPNMIVFSSSLMDSVRHMY